MFFPQLKLKCLTKKVEKVCFDNNLVADSLALFPAAFIAARPASLEALLTKTVPHSLMPSPKVPMYCNSFLATMAARSNSFHTCQNIIYVIACIVGFMKTWHFKTLWPIIEALTNLERNFAKNVNNLPPPLTLSLTLISSRIFDWSQVWDSKNKTVTFVEESWERNLTNLRQRFFSLFNKIC